MGAYYGQQSMLSRDSFFDMVFNGIDVELYAGFSAIGSINPSFEYNQTEAETFQGYKYILGVLQSTHIYLQLTSICSGLQV